MHQKAQICKLNFKEFLGAICPQTPIPGRGYGAPSQTSLSRRSGASRLIRFGPSIPPSSPNQKSWIHPWAHPPSENSGYVYAREKICHRKVGVIPSEKNWGQTPAASPSQKSSLKLVVILAQCRYTKTAQRIFKYSDICNTPVLLWIKC